MPVRHPDGRITLKARATDAIRNAVEAGRRFMSVEFHALKEHTTLGGIREITSALVPDVALVPSPEYGQTAAEVRRKVLGFGGVVTLNRRMACKCADNAAGDVLFEAEAFKDVSKFDVTAISRGAESVIASTSTDSLKLAATAKGLRIALEPLDTGPGRGFAELMAAGVPVYARPVWDAKDSDWELSEGRADGAKPVAIVKRAVFKYLLVRPVPEADAKGLDPLTKTEKRSTDWRLSTLARRALVAGSV